MFLYSALMMTELFYLTNSFGTLTSETHPEQAATHRNRTRRRRAFPKPAPSWAPETRLRTDAGSLS